MPKSTVGFLEKPNNFVGKLNYAIYHVSTMPTATLVSTLSLTAAASAALGLALGALVPGQDAPLAVGLPVMIVHMVLGILNPAGAADAKPPSAAMSAVSHASPIKWSVRALCCAELRGLELTPSSLASVPRMGGLALVRSGDEVLERLGLAQSTAGASLWFEGTEGGVLLRSCQRVTFRGFTLDRFPPQPLAMLQRCVGRTPSRCPQPATCPRRWLRCCSQRGMRRWQPLRRGVRRAPALNWSGCPRSGSMTAMAG